MKFETKVYLLLLLAKPIYYLPEWVYGRAFALNVIFGYIFINSIAKK